MRKKNGFTIVELLVVLAVIGILAAVLIPVFQGAVEDARQARQTAELEQANKALAMHVALHGEDSLEWEGMLCGEKILQAIRGELGVNDLSVTDAEEGFLAYDVRAAKVNVFDEIASCSPAAARPDLILDGLVLLEPELLDSFYGPVLEGGSFEGFLSYVKNCPKSFSDPLKQYAAGRVFVGSKDGKDQVLTLNEGQDLLPVFAKTENNTLPADFYRYVSAETAISLEGKQHASDQLYRLAEGEPDLLDYGIRGADLTLGECTLAALIRSWSVVGFTVDAGTRTITLFNEDGPIVPELPEEPGTDPGNPDPENPGTDPTDPDPEEPFELTVRIVKKAREEADADISLSVAGELILKEFVQDTDSSQKITLVEGADFEFGDKLTAKLDYLEEHLLGGWYIPSEYEGYYYQRGLTEYIITESENEVELWLVAKSRIEFEFYGGMIVPNFNGVDIAFNMSFEETPLQKIELLVNKDFLEKQSALIFANRTINFQIVGDVVIWTEDNAGTARYRIPDSTFGNQIKISIEIMLEPCVKYFAKKNLIYAQSEKCLNGHEIQNNLLGLADCESCLGRVYYIVDMSFN